MTGVAVAPLSRQSLRCAQRAVETVSRSQVGRRWNSTEATPLFLWMEGSTKGDPKQLLLPPYAPAWTSETMVTTAEQIVKLVNAHYTAGEQFVGGMGESDHGVWFAVPHGSSNDTLEYAELIQESIAAAKLERHGVPFGVHTMGIVDSLSVPLVDLGVSSLQVSLWAANPKDYQALTGLDNKKFGQVCAFIADSVDQGLNVEVGVPASQAGPARDLALSLGAQDVHIYSDK